MLFEKIKKDMVIAMKKKDKDKLMLLRTLIGEFNRIESKVITDDIAIKEIKKMYDNAKLLNNNFEMEILNNYLPIMLNENQIKIIIANLINDGNDNLGKIMSEINKKPIKHSIDNKLAVNIIKNLLKKN